jgi:hypothetical protein
VSGEIDCAGPMIVVPLFAVQVPQPITFHGLTLSASAGIATQVKSAARMILRNMPRAWFEADANSANRTADRRGTRPCVLMFVLSWRQRPVEANSTFLFHTSTCDA